ncbi:MAG: methylmalonyl-CoA mutase family protein, partial [Anaerolineales bacterium]|nr:methylmalonyl-CoA mutase family protein [Anaerolineales bacterium]
RQLEGLRRERERRDPAGADAALERLRADCVSGENVVPALLGACRAGATVGEATGVMRGVFGTYTEPSAV